MLSALLCSTAYAQIPTPDFVVKLADVHIGSLESKPDDLVKARQQFCAMFLLGYTSFPDLEVPDDTLPAEMTGVNAAVRYRNKHPDSLDRVLIAFGYKRVTFNGTWRTGFEMSQFVNEVVPKPGWWLGYCSECKVGNLNWKRFPKLPADSKIPDKLRNLIDDSRGAEANILVNGYLSPVGEYGHLGSCARELLATSVQPNDPPASALARKEESSAIRSNAYRAYDGQTNPTEGTNEP